MSITILSRHRTRPAKQILVLANNRLSILTYRRTVNRTPMDHYTPSICKIIRMLAPSTNVCQKLVKFVIYLIWCVRNRLIAQLCIPLQRRGLHGIQVPDWQIVQPQVRTCLKKTSCKTTRQVFKNRSQIIRFVIYLRRLNDFLFETLVLTLL